MKLINTDRLDELKIPCFESYDSNAQVNDD